MHPFRYTGSLSINETPLERRGHRPYITLVHLRHQQAHMKDPYVPLHVAEQTKCFRFQWQQPCSYIVQLVLSPSCSASGGDATITTLYLMCI